MPEWWPCWVCASETLCAHREHDLIAWMRVEPVRALELVAVSRIPPARAKTAESPAALESDTQGRLFERAWWAA
jgi:hypothetical protein